MILECLNVIGLFSRLVNPHVCDGLCLIGESVLICGHKDV